MQSPVVISTEKNASPLVRVFANLLRAQATRASVIELVGEMSGVFALSSVTDTQAFTVSVAANQLKLTSGVSPKANIVLHIDFARLNEPGYRPRVAHAWRHPRFTFQVAKLLSEPAPPWTDSAERFWEASKNIPHMPRGIQFTASDQHRTLTVGDDTPEVRLTGTAAALGDLLMGSSVLLESVFRGVISAQASLQHLAAISDAGIEMMMAEPESTPKSEPFSSGNDQHDG